MVRSKRCRSVARPRQGHRADPAAIRDDRLLLRRGARASRSRACSPQLVHQVAELLHADHGRRLLYDPNRRTLRFAASRASA